MTKIKLKKLKSVQYWMGNAEWTVVGAEHIKIRAVGSRWYAEHHEGDKDVGIIAKAYSRSELVADLTTKLAAA